MVNDSSVALKIATNLDALMKPSVESAGPSSSCMRISSQLSVRLPQSIDLMLACFTSVR